MLKRKNALLLILAILVLILGWSGMLNYYLTSALFSNKKYAENIKVETYLISENNLSRIIDNKWLLKIKQDKCEELFGKKVYPVLRLRNEGRLSAWGTFRFITSIGTFRVEGDTRIGEWMTYIFPGSNYMSERGDRFPKSGFTWERLYTK